MFLQPSRDITLLNSRLDVVQFCVEPKNEELVKNMLVCLQNIKSIAVRCFYHFFVAAVLKLYTGVLCIRTRIMYL
jgi:hypothetical protein